MITKELNQRFNNVGFDLITEYAVSLPFLVKNEEKFFTFEWIDTDKDKHKHLLVHDLYVRDSSTGEVTVTSVEDDSRISERIRECVLGIKAFEMETRYMELYESIVSDENADRESIFLELVKCCTSLVSDKALIEAYKFYGNEWVK